ncbi:MAG TPA: MmgE/PrpD family protein [Stellaceae bacterium]
MGLTAEIGTFLSGMAAARAVPAGAGDIVRNGFIDCIGVMIAGWDEPVARLVRETFPVTRDGDGGLAFAALGGAPPDLALAFATAAHALDYDDTGLGGHPSAVLVPAILAETRAVAADSATMIAAYVAGYEVWAELIGRDQDQHHRKGWHPSAVFGPLAAASASAVLRRLDAETARHAIGIAASLAGGIVGNFGTMTKPFQLGRAAQSGLLATRLAAAGMNAAPDAIEHEAGFLNALSPAGRVDRSRPATLGSEWRILTHGLNLKLYPVCYAQHRVLNAMADLRERHGFAPGDIDRVTVEIGETQAGMLRNHRPRTPLEAKFSAEFGVAAMAVAGNCGAAELTEAFIARADIRDLMARVRITTIAEKDPDNPEHSRYDRVAVALRDGTTLRSGEITHARGHFRRPASAESLWQKFADCATPAIGAPAARHLFDGLMRWEMPR